MITPRRCLFLLLICICLLCFAGCGGGSFSLPQVQQPPTQAPSPSTPIQHVIIVVGENRSFDNLFATFQPNDKSQHVWNLLSQGIVTATGDPGPNFAAALQQQASDTDYYRLSPPQSGPYPMLPQPNVTFDALPFSLGATYNITYDPGLALNDQNLLKDGGVLNLDPKEYPFTPDQRFQNLPPGPFPITKYTAYTDTTGDPMHRFYQMWQQIGCNIAKARASNPSGCMKDQYAWVATTVGWGLENTPPPDPFTDQSTFQGGVSLGFYNMAAGDEQTLSSLANTYAISDNYHQPVLGGTGTNSAFIGSAAPLFYSDANGNPAVPIAAQIENPDPYPGSNNWYQQDGFLLVDPNDASNAAYTKCSDNTRPGVRSIMEYLNALPYKPFNKGNCAPNTYYLVNDEKPSYDRNGNLFSDQTYSVGPSTVKTIGDSLSAANLTWKYYGEGFSNDLGTFVTVYCDICNPFQYSRSIMTSDQKNNITDLTNFFADVQSGTLPAVAIVKPDDVLDAHPGTSLPIVYEAFINNLISTVKAQDSLWQNTAIFITWDESGGLYDSGYIQPIDFFGDGPRIPLLVVSKYAKPHYVDHTYADHASLTKFIEKNWGLKPLSTTSRDNLPTPTSDPATPYFPTNSPAIGDLMTLFNFSGGGQ